MYEFINRTTGKKVRCVYNLVTPNSKELIKGFQTCVRDEYGETYPRMEIYDTNKLSQLILSGNIAAMIAIDIDSGDPVSSLALSQSRELADVPEITMHVVRKPYRGYGIGTSLTRVLLDMPFTSNYNAITTHSVTFHPLAQHQTISCGLVPCGFLFLVHSNEILKHTFDTNGCLKQTFAVGIYPKRKKDAGTLYVPDEHREFIKTIYDNLNVKYVLDSGNSHSIRSEINLHIDEMHHSLMAQIFRGGDDLEGWIKELMTGQHHPNDTINILVNMNDPGAVRTYEILKLYGFVFTGVHPLCGNGEFMILNNSMNLEIPFDKLCIDEGYKDIFTYIRNCSGGK